MGFEVKTEQFVGPFDLLLELIEKRKLFINEISLAKVTDDFIGYIEQQQNFPLGESANFILVAATLLLIKSKSLLPTLELTTEEQSDIKSLELRLAIYKRIREAGETIQKHFGRTILYEPAVRNFIEPVFSPGSADGGALNKDGILAAMQRVLAQIPKAAVNLPKVMVQKVISLEEMIERLTKRVEHSLKMSFRDFAGKNGAANGAEKVEKVNVIVSFLAMLELVKRGIIQVEQRATFDDIEIETPSVGVPKYS